MPAGMQRLPKLSAVCTHHKQMLADHLLHVTWQRQQGAGLRHVGAQRSLLTITIVRYAPVNAAKSNLTIGLGKQSATKDQYTHAEVDARVLRGSCATRLPNSVAAI